MENKTEDEVRKRWEQEAKDKADREDEAQQRSNKRPRLLEDSGSSRQTSVQTKVDRVLELLGAESNTAAKGRSTAKKPPRAAAAKARGKVTEIIEDEDDEISMWIDARASGSFGKGI
jgi:hypothetical protein